MGTVRTGRVARAPMVIGDMQMSGNLLVYGVAYNQNFGTGRDRYVTSGEMAAAAGATNPAAPFTSVQFNDSGSFGGDAALTWQKTPDILTVSGTTAQYGPILAATQSLAAGRFVTSGELKPAGTVTLGGNVGDVQFHGATALSGEAAFNWQVATNRLTVSGSTRHYGVFNAVGTDDLGYGVSIYPDGSQAGGLTYIMIGSGYMQGSNVHYRLQNVPSLDHWIDLPVQFDAGLQVSGGLRVYDATVLGATATPRVFISAAGDVQLSGTTVAYRPLYATAQTAAGRYVTSGELTAATSPALPFGSIQFNNAGAFGGDADLRWDTTAMTLTVSGGGLRVEAPAIFRVGAGIQASGAAVVVYDRVQIGRTGPREIIVDLASRGQVLMGHGTEPTTGYSWVLGGSGILRGTILFEDLDPGDHVSFAVPTVFGSLAPVAISGELRAYSSIIAGAIATPRLQISPAGEMQLSGVTVTYRSMYGTNQTGAGRYVTSGDLTNTITAPGGPPQSVQFNTAGAFDGEDALRWIASSDQLIVSGFATVQNTLTAEGIVNVEGRVNVVNDPNNAFKRQQVLWGDSGTPEIELYGSGTVNGSFTFGRRWPGEVDTFDLPVRFTSNSSLQLSGNTVAYRPIFATNQNGAARYVTSGEVALLVPAAPVGSFQFNNGGVFGGDADARWDTTSMVATFSGGGIRVEAPAIFRAGAGVQVSGALRIYNGAEITGNLDLDNWSIIDVNQVIANATLISPTVATDHLASSATTQINVDSAAVFTTDVQLSGITVAYRPLYGTNQTGGGRYVTSGELTTGAATSPALPFGAVQFNNAGVFGGNADLRWEDSSETFTVSGAEMQVQPPTTVFRQGVTLSGLTRAYGIFSIFSTAAAGGMFITTQNGNTWQVGNGTPRAFGRDWFVAGSGMFFAADIDFTTGSRISGPIMSTATLQLSGITRQYADILFGNTASAAGTRFSAAGELQLSGAVTRAYGEVHWGPTVTPSLIIERVTGAWTGTQLTASGDLRLTVSTPIATNLNRGAQLVLGADSTSNAGQFQARTSLSSAAVVMQPSLTTRAAFDLNEVSISGAPLRVYHAARFGSVGNTQISPQGDVQASGQLIVYNGAYGQTVNGSGRYLTSGEIAVGTIGTIVDMTPTTVPMTTGPGYASAFALVSGYTIPANTFTAVGGRVELEMWAVHRQRNTGSATWGIISFLDDTVLWSGVSNVASASGVDTRIRFTQLLTSIGSNQQAAHGGWWYNHSTVSSGVQPGSVNINALLDYSNVNTDLGFDQTVPHWLKIVFVGSGNLAGAGAWSVATTKLMTRVVYTP